MKEEIEDLEDLKMPERENNNKLHHNELSKDAKSSMLKRVIYGVVMTAIVVPCLILGEWFYLAVVTLVIGFATYEMAKVPGRHFSIFVLITTFIVMYSLVYWLVIKNGMKNDWSADVNNWFNTIWISPIAIATMIGVYFVVVIFKSDFVVKDAFYLIAMTLLLALGFQGILYVRYIPFKVFSDPNLNTAASCFKYGQSALLVFYLLIAICFNDMGAYFIGVLFGKHKMAPRISPKKTWEGFAGGVVTSFILSSSFALICAACNFSILPRFNLNGWYWIVLCSFILPFAGNLGDFAFSAIKREFNVKDYSHILGPHGGILDRIDSVLFGALTLSILVEFINNNWSFLK